MQVYYFTRTGKSENIANQIAQSKGLTANKITDNKDWSGKISYLKAGASAAKKELYSVEYTPLDGSGEIILVFPMWAGTFPPAIRGFLEEAKDVKITAVMSSAAVSLKQEEQKRFHAFYEVKGKDMNAPAALINNNT